MTVDELLTNIDNLSNYWNGICDVIRQAHQAYNDDLIANDNTKYRCPG
jgi:hypothetical protein